jgi:hypothetical protein
LQKVLEFKAGAQSSDSKTSDLKTEDEAFAKIKAFSAFTDSLYELASKAEVLHSIGNKIMTFLKSAQVQQLQKKVPIFVSLDPSICYELSLGGKVNKMIAIVAQVEQLNN